MVTIREEFVNEIKCEQYEVTENKISTDLEVENVEKPNENFCIYQEGSEDFKFVNDENCDKSFECQKCETKFTRKHSLSRHQRNPTCIKSTRNEDLCCKLCGKEYTKRDSLRYHMRGHMGMNKKKRGDYPCSHCDMILASREGRRIHIRLHTGEKPYSCDFCDKSFPAKTALITHRRTHTLEKPYKCAICSAAFTTKAHLNRHAKMHTGERPHVCKFCGKGFIQTTELKVHMFHHTQENGFKCTLCNQIFNRKDSLTTHIAGLHDFRCRICDIDFPNKRSLSIHRRTHGKEQPCHICNVVYKKKRTLMEHLRRKHNAVDRTDREEISNQSSDSDVEQHTELQVNVSKEEEETNAIDKHIYRKLKSESRVENGEEIFTQNVQSVATECQIKTGAIVEDSRKRQLFMDDKALRLNVGRLLNVLLEQSMLQLFGWPLTPVDQVLNEVVRKYGHNLANYHNCSDHATQIRENTKLLLTTVINNTSIKELLNNHTIDEVICRVLKMGNVDQN